MKRILLLTTISLMASWYLNAQNVFDPNDPLVRYNATATLGSAQKPNPDVQGLQKWVADSMSSISKSYSTQSYKAYFMNIQGVQLPFRMKFPKSYGNPDSAGKKYPVMLFFHGAGEAACNTNGGVYNNEKQLLHGGRLFRDHVDNNRFDGFLIYPQVVNFSTNCNGNWGVAPASTYYMGLIRLMDSLVKYTNADVDRLIAVGLSNGGGAAWSMAAAYPNRVAATAPSAAATGQTNYTDYVHLPIYFASGGTDNNPTPALSQSVNTSLKNLGADIKYILYPTLGHSMWTNHWNEPDFVPFLNKGHKANPLVFFGRDEWCPENVINAKLGITAGFAAYEWEKDGVVIARRENGSNQILNAAHISNFSAGGNELTVKSYGTYKVRFKRTANGAWSVWSPRPAVIRQKAVTQTPNIRVEGTQSHVLPSLDGKNTVTLGLPEGFYAYEWYNADNNQLIGSDRTFNAGIGRYKARVVEQYGCGTIYSPVFEVVAAAGTIKPDPARTLTGVANSLTSIQLDWNENPNAGVNETGFEIYRSFSAGGPYTLIHVTAPNTVSYLDNGLTTNTRYYYIVRAVGTGGAAENSNEITVITGVDQNAPTAPIGLTLTSQGKDFASISWTASTDDAGVDKYDIYLNNSKAFTTTATNFSIPDLEEDKTYTIVVKARDKAGNVSNPSNQVTVTTSFNPGGINFKYYEGTWSNIPNFNTLTPLKSGVVPTPTLANRNKNDNFAFLWEGLLKIDVAANYTFEICSDDGSRLWIGTGYVHGTSTINNDGAHGNQCRNAVVNLQPGLHSIAAAFFEVSGDEIFTLKWQNDQGLAKSDIPSSHLLANAVSAELLPNTPNTLQATVVNHKTIDLNWVNGGGVNNGYEIVRSTTENGIYQQVASVNGTSYSDTSLTPNTTYFYKVRSISNDGESDYTSAFTGIYYPLDSNFINSWNTTGGTNTNGTQNSTFVNYFNQTDRKYGSKAAFFNGTNNYITINGAQSNLYPNIGGYSKRTVALWIKPNTIANNKVIFDIGNNANGLGLRYNSTNNSLEAGIASASVRFNTQLENFQSNANWRTGDWNHVAVVYDVNKLMLYLNGVLVSSNNNLSFLSIAANAGNASRFGYSGGATENVFNTASTTSDYYNGFMDEIYIINGALSADELEILMNNQFVSSNAKTLVAPAAPATPTNLVATVLSSSSIQLSWNDNSANETGFEIWKSVSNNQAFRLAATIPANGDGTATYVDDELFANANYFYKVIALGDVQNSAYSNEATAVTPNSKPVVDKIADVTVKYGTPQIIKLTASDPDSDALTFSSFNLPYFATITEVSNGIAELEINAEIWDIGYYETYIVVSDALGAKDTTYFTMVINDNNVPVFNNVTDKTVNEGQLANVPFNVSDDENTGLLKFRPVVLPTWATLTSDSTTGTGNIQLLPGFAVSGVHPVKISVEDQFGAISFLEFNVIVNDVDPSESYKLNFVGYGPTEAGWNTVSVRNSPFDQANLRNHKDEVTSARIRLTKGAIQFGTSGTSGGNGVYPSNVRADFFQWGYVNNNLSDTIEVTLSGLSAGKKYNLVFYSGSGCTYCGLDANSVTTFKVGTKTAQVRFFNNTNSTDTLQQITPNAAGEIVITMIGDAKSGVGGNLNAMVIEANQEDGTAPLKPLNLTATPRNKGVRLTWIDQAYNESAYNVYRANSKSGPYTLLNPGASNRDSTGYNNDGLNSFTNYYYYVVGVNSVGQGVTSDTLLFQTLNNNPTITSVASFNVKAGNTANANFTVADDPGDVVNVELFDNPSFITLTKLSNTSYRINAAPSSSNVGKHVFDVVVTDDKGGKTTTVVTVSVSDQNTRSIFVNFAPTGFGAPAPWNNMLGYGGVNNTLNNLLDENGTNSGYSLTLVNKWGGLVNNGQITSDNSGVFPDQVLNHGWWDHEVEARQIRFNNLNNNKVYNIVVMASRSDGVRSIMRLSVGSVADTIDASFNSHFTGNINRVVPSNGSITLDILKLGTSPYTVITAIQLEELDNAIVLSPNNLNVEVVGRDAANITWSDRNHNETSFQLQVSSDPNFSTLLHDVTLPANSVSFKATNLPVNKRVWARVRSVVNESYSDWSNIGTNSTSLSRVFVNFNIAELNVPSPWNNLESNPTEPFVKSGLNNQSGAPSGISIEFITPMNGDNNFGLSTGNNSGVVPDNALRSNYWIDKNQKSNVKLTGLNQAKKYRIGFFGSMSTDGWFAGNYTAKYTINGQQVLLNSWLNDRKVVYITNVAPNSDGEVTIEFSTIDEAAWAFNGGMIIESYDEIPLGVEQNGDAQRVVNLNPQLQVDVVNVETLAENTFGNAEIFPNPFKDQLNIQYTATKSNQHVVVNVFNMNGSLVHTQQETGRYAGKQLITLNLGNSRLTNGYYLVSVVVDGKIESTKKVIKTN